MSEATKRPPGRPRKYEGDGEGAPFLGIRLDPPIHDHIRSRAEGAREYIQRLVSDDRATHETDGNSQEEDVLNLHYWRVFYKGSSGPVAQILDCGEDAERLESLESLQFGYHITAEQLGDAEAVVTWMCQLDDKSWVTPHVLQEFFRILRAFDLARHYF